MAGVNDPEIHKMVEKLSTQFRYMNNPLLKDAFAALEVSSDQWRCIERLTSPSEVQALQGYGFGELYEQVLAAAKFVFFARKQIASNLPIPSDATLFDKMAIKNFPGNLSIMADQLRAIYGKLLHLDTEENTEPICHTIPELDRILSYLQSSD